MPYTHLHLVGMVTPHDPFLRMIHDQTLFLNQSSVPDWITLELLLLKILMENLGALHGLLWDHHLRFCCIYHCILLQRQWLRPSSISRILYFAIFRFGFSPWKELIAWCSSFLIFRWLCPHHGSRWHCSFKGYVLILLCRQSHVYVLIISAGILLEVHISYFIEFKYNLRHI